MPTPVGVPDLLSRLQMSRAHAQTKRQMNAVQTEVATGIVSDKFAATGGDPGRLLALERSLSRLESRAPLLGMARTRAAAIQTALADIATGTEELGARLLAGNRDGMIQSAKLTAAEAGHALGRTIRALNTSVGGRALFAGENAEGPAIKATADRLIAVARAALAAHPTSLPDALAALDAWFAAAPGGPPTISVDLDGDGTPEEFTSFADEAWAGFGDAPPVELGENDRMAYAVRADARALKDMMKNLALAAAGADSALANDPDEGRANLAAIYDHAGRGLIAAGDGLTLLRASLGLAENRIEQAQSRTAAERTSLGLARAEMIGADPYEASTELQKLETQLQMIYAITARTANLSLLSFLR